MRSLQKLSFSLSLFTMIPIVSSIQCLNEQGQPTDYWAIFKLPQGSTYYYYDQKTGLVLSTYSLNDTTQGALTHTMQQLWNIPSNYILYNDEYIGQEEYNYTVGHSKGVWAWDRGSSSQATGPTDDVINDDIPVEVTAKETGIFIQHSLPNFPTGGPRTSTSYEGIPSNTWTYGQHLFCTSANINTVVEAWMYVLPQIYEYSINLTATTVSINNIIEGSYNSTATCIQIAAAQQQRLFAKTAAWNADLYAACLAPALQQPLTVESWQHGTLEGPVCQPAVPYNTVDVQTVDFGYASGTTPTQFSIDDDHSKWAVTATNTGDTVCFSDINRVTTQYERNGGAICIVDAQLWKYMTLAVTSTDSDC